MVPVTVEIESILNFELSSHHVMHMEVKQVRLVSLFSMLIF